MWSHTIHSSAPKSTNPPVEKPARATKDPRKEDGTTAAPGEDMTKGFDADGFSKTSKVHAYKKPLTVPKAPSFSRTTSRTGQTTTSGTDPPPKESQNKTTQPIKSTPTPRVGTSTRVPRTATPTQSSSRASKAGTPSRTKQPVTSPKHTVSGRRPTSSSTENGIRSPGSENAGAELDTSKADETKESLASDGHSKDENDFDDITKAKDLQNHKGLEELEHTIAIKDGEIRDLQTEIQGLRITKDARIEELQVQIRNIETRSGKEKEEAESALLTQIKSLQTEVDDARKEKSDLEATHRKVQEEYDRDLGLKDEEIQRLSQAAHERRREQEAKESALTLKGEFQRLQTQHKRELDEAVAAASAQVEAAQADRDGLIQSRDKEIKEMSELVQELQEKIEKAHQADKNELREAEERHQKEIKDKFEIHERELQETASKHQEALRDEASQYELKLQDEAARFGELQQSVSKLEQELRDAAARHVKEMDDAKTEHQKTLLGTTEGHERMSRDTTSKNQKEMNDLISKHQEELENARTRSKQISEESTKNHQQEIETLKASHKEELEAATSRQEKALMDAAAEYRQKYQSLETKHLEEVKTAADKGEEESRTLSAKHQQIVQDLNAKFESQIEEAMATSKQDSGNAAIQNQEAIESMIAKHRDESADAVSQIEILKAEEERHQQALADLAMTHNQEIEHTALKHQQELHEMIAGHSQELVEAKTKYQELESASLVKDQSLREAAKQHEDDVGRLQNQLQAAVGSAALLETTLRDLNLQRQESDTEATLKHEQELRTANHKYEEELESLRTIYATAVEEIDSLRRKLQDVEHEQSQKVEEELQSLRTIYAGAVEEATALRRKVEALDQERSEAVEEAAILKTSMDNLELKRSEALSQLSSLQDVIKDDEFDRNEAAVEVALLKDKLELADRRFEQDQQAVSDLQRQVQVLQDQIAELTTDKDLDQTEAAVDAALFKDKLELADLEIHLHKGTISALQNEIERLQSQIAENSADISLDQNEAVVDVTLLKDKLELANIQIRQAKGTVSNLQEEIEGLKAQITASAIGTDLDQDEAAVEIALLKNTLELSNLETHQDKATITTLRKQIDTLQAAQVAADSTPIKTGTYTHHQLRNELSMLERQHGAQMVDLESLKADVAAESKVREQEWKKRADVWDQLASELQGMKMQLVGTGDMNLKAGSAN